MRGGTWSKQIDGGWVEVGRSDVPLSCLPMVWSCGGVADEDTVMPWAPCALCAVCMSQGNEVNGMRVAFALLALGLGLCTFRKGIQTFFHSSTPKRILLCHAHTP